MKIQIVGDLHLELHSPRTNNYADTFENHEFDEDLVVESGVSPND